MNLAGRPRRCAFITSGFQTNCRSSAASRLIRSGWFKPLGQKVAVHDAWLVAEHFCENGVLMGAADKATGHLGHRASISGGQGAPLPCVGGAHQHAVFAKNALRRAPGVVNRDLVAQCFK